MGVVVSDLDLASLYFEDEIRKFLKLHPAGSVRISLPYFTGSMIETKTLTFDFINMTRKWVWSYTIEFLPYQFTIKERQSRSFKQYRVSRPKLSDGVTIQGEANLLKFMRANNLCYFSCPEPHE